MVTFTRSLPAPTSILDHDRSIPPLGSALGTMSTSSSIVAIVAAASSVTVTSSPDSHSGAESGECQLLGPFALVIQASLGALALLSLVYKRWRERPQRPLKVWAFDASKQVVGSMLLHIANLLMSMLSSGELNVTPSTIDDYQANPCSFYLLNLAIDTTIGIPILIVLLKVLAHGFALTALGQPPESIQSGNYGHPPKASWWLKQSFIYFIGLVGMKLCVFIIFQLCPWIGQVGDWALKWTEGNETLQVFFVMLFFPVVMNALQYYIIDGFIKDQKHEGHHERIPSEDEDDGGANSHDEVGRRSQSQDGTENADGDISGDEVNKQAEISQPQEPKDLLSGSEGSTTATRGGLKTLDEYDPITDGERSGIVGREEANN